MCIYSQQFGICVIIYIYSFLGQTIFIYLYKINYKYISQPYHLPEYYDKNIKLILLLFL